MSSELKVVVLPSRFACFFLSNLLKTFKRVSLKGSSVNILAPRTRQKQSCAKFGLSGARQPNPLNIYATALDKQYKRESTPCSYPGLALGDMTRTMFDEYCRHLRKLCRKNSLCMSDCAPARWFSNLNPLIQPYYVCDTIRVGVTVVNVPRMFSEFFVITRF